MLKEERLGMESNLKTYIFMIAITLVSSLLLSYSYSALKDRTDKNIEFDIKRNIVKSAGYNIEKMSKDEILTNYENNIVEIILDAENKRLDDVKWSSLVLVEDRVSGLSNYIYKSDKIKFNKDSSDPSVNKYLPLFYHNDKQVYVIPISGKGLWSTLFGFIAIGEDGNTVKGITFYKHKETPGLGGEVDKEWFQKNFVDKQIFRDNELVSVEVLKGTTDMLADQEKMYAVDGITGATITSKGLSNFLLRDLLRYEQFLRSSYGK